MKHFRARLVLLASASLCAALAAPGIAQAEEADARTASAKADTDSDTAGSGTVIVTARKRNEKLQDVPIAISAVGGNELTTQHNFRLADYGFRVPSFSAAQQNTRVSGLYIRGVGGNASNDGAEGGVGLIVDNVFFTHVGFSWLDFVDLEGIEVVRGPQGTLLGKNTTVGAIIVKTAKPSFEPELKLSATIGNHGRYQLRGNATGPLIADKLAYRLTFSRDDGGGWITNAVDGAKYLNSNRWSVRGQLLFTPSSNISDRLIVEHYNSHEYNNFYPAVGDVPNNLNLNGSVLSTRTSYTSKLQSIFGYTPNYNAPYNAAYDTQQPLTAHTDGVSNELNWNFGGSTLTSVSAWRRLYFRPHNDGDYSPLPIDRNGYDVDVNQYSQEVRLASNKGGLLDWTLGAYYLHEDLESDFRFQFFQDASAFFLAPAALPSAVLNGIDLHRDGKLKIDSGALFGQATLHFTDALSLTAGLRGTRERKHVTVAGYSLGAEDLSAYGASAAALAGARAQVLSSINGTPATLAGTYVTAAGQTRNALSWLVNPSWKVARNILLYASASYGEKSGAANTSITYSAAQNGLTLIQPEKSLDFEAGLKTSWWRGKLTANINLYNDRLRNYQAAQIDPTTPALGAVLANVGTVRLRGVEFEATAAPLHGLNLWFNTAYNDAKYLSYVNAPAPIEYQAALAALEHVSPAAATLNLSGQQVIGAPKWKVQGGVDFNRPIGHGLVFTSYANTSWQSRVALANPFSLYGRQSAYAILNAGLGIKTGDDKWSLLFWGKNLTNRLYAYGFGAATATSPNFEILGDPRTFGATLTGRFR